MVRCDRLSKDFVDNKKGADGKKGIVHAVEQVSFETPPGQIFGLLGVNGAGKTTVLRILSTVLLPTSGEAEVAGFDVRKDPAKVRASIGFLSTSTALYGRLTAKEMIEYFGGLYGLSGQTLKSKTAAVIDQLEIGSFADRLCDKLSTGQKQRVSIARTILHDPPVLFFDEPTAGLDVVSSQTVMEFIEHARTSGKTVVFSTHIMSEVERLCDRIGVIHMGRLRALGTVADLKAETGEASLEKAFLKLVEYSSDGSLAAAAGALL